MKKGFTLIELVVAIGILAMMLGFTSIIFKVSIKGSRVVGANAEIMQKLRAVTDQLDRDLRGLDKTTPLLIWFEKDPNNDDRFDQIMFFATGDFQSTQLYDENTGEPISIQDEDDPTSVHDAEYISGDAARIYYGQAQGDSVDEVVDKPSERILCRRRHIFTSDADIEEWPKDTNDIDINFKRKISGYLCNDRFEHDSLSLTQWKDVDEDIFKRVNTGIVTVVFENRPEVKMGPPVTYHNLLSEEAASFKIQWAYWNPDDDPEDDEVRWFPSDDPDRDGISDHSHFQINGDDKFGVYFNVAGDDPDNRFGTTEWYGINNDELIFNYKKSPNCYFERDIMENFYPRALKFTFTIYDSKGVIKNGRTFTHIVYLGE